jgi:hypothetical protein
MLKALGHAALELGPREERGAGPEPVVVKLADKRGDVAALKVLSWVRCVIVISGGGASVTSQRIVLYVWTLKVGGVLVQTYVHIIDVKRSSKTKDTHYRWFG